MKLIKNIILLFVSILFTLFLAEAILRLFYPAPFFYSYPDKYVGHRRLPSAKGVAYGRKGEYKTYISINSIGFRDVEHAIDKPKDVYRIVILGDSFTEAIQIPFDKIYSQLLLEKLKNLNYSKKIEIISLACGAYGTAQQYLALKEYGMKYKPDLVILGFYEGNDVCDNSSELAPQYDRIYVNTRPFYNLDNDGNLSLTPPSLEKIYKLYKPRDSYNRIKYFLRKNFVLYHLAKDLVFNNPRLAQLLMDLRLVNKQKIRDTENIVYTKKGYPILYDVFKKKYDENWEKAWIITYKILLMMEALCEENGADFFVMSIPSSITVDIFFYNKRLNDYPSLKSVDIDINKPNRLMENFLSRENIDYLMLSDIFCAYIEKHPNQQLYLVYDGHLSGFGHEKVAGALFEEIKQYL